MLKYIIFPSCVFILLAVGDEVVGEFERRELVHQTTIIRTSHTNSSYATGNWLKTIFLSTKHNFLLVIKAQIFRNRTEIEQELALETL